MGRKKKQLLENFFQSIGGYGRRENGNEIKINELINERLIGQKMEMDMKFKKCNWIVIEKLRN